jgi:hypothetical protein
MRQRVDAAMPRATLALRFVLVAVVGLLAANCGADQSIGIGSPKTSMLVADAAFPVALVAEADGGLLYGERLTGRVRRVRADGTLEADPVTTLATVGANDDQRGLLGLTRDPRGRLFGAWTRADDGRLVVGQIQAPTTEAALAEPRLVWVGPVSAALANGGHLAFSPGGRLVIGIGDLLADRALADDPTVPNRKLLSLDPDGAANQTPVILSTGWNNPFAFTFARDGTLWVADNTGAEGPERIGRGDQPADRALGLGGPVQGAIAPSVLVSVSADQLGLCGFISGRMQLVHLTDGRPSPPSADLADSCSTGGAVLADGRIVTATPTEIRVRAGLGR